MKVTTERLPKSLVALDIELDPQRVSKGLDQAARKLSQQYRIPGFRPGKAPRFIVENYLGRERIMEEASDDLMNAALKEAMKSENLTPVGKVSLESFDADPFHFRVTVPVEPTVELAPYTSFQLPLEREEVREESVQKLLDAQREQHVVLKSLETPRPAQASDQVSVKISSDLDEEEDDDDDDDLDEADFDEALNADLDAAIAEDEAADAAADEDEDDEEDDEDEDEAADAEDEAADAAADVAAEDEDDEDEDEEDYEPDTDAPATEIVLEEGRTRPEFLAALIGSQPGETHHVTITYGDDESNEQLRGKTVNYTLQVENVQERLLPDWEELPTLTEFEGDFEAFRQNARQRLEHAADEKARRAVLDAFITRAVDESQIDLPDVMIEERAGELFHEQVAQFSRYGLTEEQLLQSMGKTHEEAVADYNEQATRDVRVQLVLREIIRREELTLSAEDVAAETERFLEDYDPQRRTEVRQLLDNDRMRSMIASTALDRKLRDRIVALTTGNGAGDSAPMLEASEGAQPEASDATNEVGGSAGSIEPEAASAPVFEASEGAVGEEVEAIPPTLDTSEMGTSGV